MYVKLSRRSIHTLYRNMNQTQHLQSVILSIAKDIDKMCRDNGIKYYLFGGTALGAKRHKGFIPWDDDLDIVFDPDNYNKFIALCKSNLDTDKYSLQEGGVDWPEHFSKIRLKGTHIKEYGDYYTNKDMDGIFVDIFRVDNAPDAKMARALQYFWGKLLLTYAMKEKGYKAESIVKKAINVLASTMRFKPLHAFAHRQYYKYNDRSTNWTSDVMGRTRWNNAFIPRSVYGEPTEVEFEDTKLLAHQDLDKYLTISYGDYMKLPPEDKRVGLHIIHIDFGKY